MKIAGKEEMIKFFDNFPYYDEEGNPIPEKFKNQPERLNPETHCEHDWFHPPLSDYKQCSKCGEQTDMNYVRCDSLNSMET